MAIRSPPAGTRQHWKVCGGVARSLALSWPSFSTAPMLGPKVGRRGQHPRLARACLYLGHLIAFGLSPLISALPVVSMLGNPSQSCDPVVSKAKDECLISALTVGSEAFLCLVWCLPHIVPDTGLLRPPPFALSPLCFRSLSPVLYPAPQKPQCLSSAGFGAQGSLRGVGRGCGF